MNPVERFFRRLDAFQQRHLVTAFVFGIIKKYGDDNAGSLVSALAHSAFGSLFPLLLFMVTILGIVLGSHSHLRTEIIHSTVAQFPIIGNDLRRNISALRSHSALGLGVGLGGTIWGSVGLSQNGIFTMMQVWNLPGPGRPNYPKRLARGIGFLSLLAFGLLVTTFLANVVPQVTTGIWTTVGAAIVSGLVNCAEYLVAFRILTPGSVRLRQLVPGAIAGGVAWTILQEFGGLIANHYWRNDSPVYGLFAIVLVLFAWIYIGVRVTVYAAELNVVLARRLWPRAIVQPPLTRADRRVMAAQANQNRRRPEQRVRVTFTEDPQTEDEFFARRGAPNANGSGTGAGGAEPVTQGEGEGGGEGEGEGNRAPASQ